MFDYAVRIDPSNPAKASVIELTNPPQPPHPPERVMCPDLLKADAERIVDALMRTR